MTLEIYVDQVFRSLAAPFYEEYLGEIGKMIYIDDSTVYHTSKFTKKFYAEVELLYMIWSAQFLDLNPIKNFWCIIKIWVSSYYHKIHLVKEIKVAISEKWEKLIDEDYKKCIESIHQRYKLVILAKRRSIKY